MKNYSKQYISRYVGTIMNKANMPESADIASKIDYYPLEAIGQDIENWSDARLTALDTLAPDWEDLIRVYDDVMIDAHLSGISRAIKKQIKAKKWVITDQDGDVDEELTKIFTAKWVKNLMDWIVDGELYPYSVIQLGDWDEGFKEITQIKREYYIPQYNQIKKSLFYSSGPGAKLNTWDLDDEELKKYFIVVKSNEELGVMDHVAPLVLGKKHMMIYWWRYGEQFGIPFRVGKTEVDDPKRRKNLENAFTNMGNNMWMVANTDDEIQLLSASDNSGTVTVFLENLKFANNEISKNIAGAIGVFDEKSYVGSSEAGERLLHIFAGSYCSDIEDTINNELIPRIVESYNDKRFADKIFKFENAETISFDEKIKAVDVLAKYFDLDPDEIEQKFGFKVKPKSVIDKVQNLYAKPKPGHRGASSS